MRLLFAAAVLPMLLVQQPSSGELEFTAPDGWRTRPPSSSMRVAEFLLPKAAGDSEDAELVIYYFGGGGGSVEANITRWQSQMRAPDGAQVAAPRRETRKINGLDVTLVDVSGTYVAELRPGAAERHNKPGFRMRAAVIGTARGPYFIKLVGPQRTIERWDQAFQAFVGSLRYRESTAL